MVGAILDRNQTSNSSKEIQMLMVVIFLSQKRHLLPLVIIEVSAVVVVKGCLVTSWPFSDLQPFLIVIWL